MDLFIKNYKIADIVIFEQHFPIGISNAAVNDENPETTISTGFPVIAVPDRDTGLGYITPGGNMMGNTKLSFGPFYNLRSNVENGENAIFMDGRQSGLSVIFDASSGHSTVWSPLTEFMAQYTKILPPSGQK